MQGTVLVKHLKTNNIDAVFHYLSVHKPVFYHKKHEGRELENSDTFSDCLLRLPLYAELTKQEAEFVSDKIIEFYKK